MALLEGSKVTKLFGGLAAVKDVDFSISPKEIVGLIGPNGAGKTTLFNCISGVYPPSSGVIRFKGQDITKRKPYEICRLGVGRTYQIVRPFLNLTVIKNVMIGVLFGKGKSVSMHDAHHEALKFLEFTELMDQKDMLAKNLTLPTRKRLEIARAIATEPEIILLDEVVAGLNPSESLQAEAMIRRIRDDLGITVLWVEHVMRAIMGVAERIIVLSFGMKIAEGSPQEVANDKNVIDAYLGERYIY